MSAGSHMGKGYTEIGRIKGQKKVRGAQWSEREQVREMRNKWIKI